MRLLSAENATLKTESVCPWRVVSSGTATGAGVRSARPATPSRNAPLRWFLVLLIAPPLGCLRTEIVADQRKRTRERVCPPSNLPRRGGTSQLRATPSETATTPNRTALKGRKKPCPPR